MIDGLPSWVWWVLSENWLISIEEDTPATIKRPPQTHRNADGRPGGSTTARTRRPAAKDPGLRIGGNDPRGVIVTGGDPLKAS